MESWTSSWFAIKSLWMTADRATGSARTRSESETSPFQRKIQKTGRLRVLQRRLLLAATCSSGDRQVVLIATYKALSLPVTPAIYNVHDAQRTEWYESLGPQRGYRIPSRSPTSCNTLRIRHALSSGLIRPGSSNPRPRPDQSPLSRRDKAVLIETAWAISHADL